MRIVYVLTTLAVGGTERQVLAIARRMAARGHAVALLVLTPHEADDCATTLDVVHLDIRKTAASVIAGVRRAAGFLRAFRPDVIHSHNFHGNMLARMLRLFCRNVRLISTIHNVYEGGRWRMLAYRLTDGLVDRTTAVSAAVAQRYGQLKAVAKNKCVVITNGIETDAFVPEPERRAAMRAQMGVAEEFVWLWVGRNAPAKDIPNLLGAFATAWRTAPQMQLWMAGFSQALSDAAANARITVPPEALQRVRHLGIRSDIPALLDAADAFVLASAWEGMPLAVGEAMAMEKPVVATDVGGVRELVGDAGVLVPAKDANALAEAMLKVTRLPEEPRFEMGRSGRERILNCFSIEAKAAEWEALYGLVAGHSTWRGRVVP